MARLSIGGMLMRATLGPVRRAAAELRGGTFDFGEGMVTQAEMNQKLARRREGEV